MKITKETIETRETRETRESVRVAAGGKIIVERTMVDGEFDTICIWEAGEWGHLRIRSVDEAIAVQNALEYLIVK